MEIDISGVEDIMLIQQEKMQRKQKNIFEINYKKIWNMTR